MATTVTHGIDDSGLSTARPSRGHDGHVFYETDTKCCRVWSDAEEEWLPLDAVGFVYDVTGGDSGALGPHDFPNARIPAGFIVNGGVIDVITTFTSAGSTATLAISMQTDDDLVAAVAINAGGSPWAAGLHEVVPQPDTSTTWIKATADRAVRIDVGVQALTAGKLRGYLFGRMSEQTVTEEESSTSSSSSFSSSSSSNSSSSTSSSVSSSSSSHSSSSSSSSS